MKFPGDPEIRLPIGPRPVFTSDGDNFRFLVTRLRRQTNKTNFCFEEAEDAVLRALKDMEN